jgi:putative DNA primase/helicase
MIHDIAAGYAAQGWHIVRLAPGTKVPTHADWPDKPAQPADFSDADNIGVALGKRSANLVDVDLDCSEAVALAPAFLPPTATFGRASKPRSHWLYITTDAPPPRVKKPPHSHIELRSTGGQTMMPGSYHESGEEVEWCDTPPEGPTRLTTDTLRAAWCKLGVATLLARGMPELAKRPGEGGGVHDLCLAIAGSLKRVGWPLDAVVSMVEHALGDGPPHRLEAVHATYGREDGDPTTGWPTLERLLGPKVTGELRRFAEDPSHGYTKPVDALLAEVAHDRSDLGNARRLLDRAAQDLRFAPGLGWLRWSSTHWALTDEPYSEAQAVADDLRACTLEGTAGNALRKWGTKTGSRGALSAMIALASHQPEVRIDAAQLDAIPHELATPGGIVDLRTGAIRPATREDLHTRLTPIAPDPRHPTPRWDRFLLETHPDPDLRAYLLRWLGYCLTADVSEHAFALWWGPSGRNGKGVMLRVLRRVLGDHACEVAPEVLLRKPLGQHPTALQDFRGRRLMVASETDEGKPWDEGLVKRLTGGDEIRARGMHRDFASFFPTHKLIVAANERPIVRGQGPAFWSRVHILPWTVSFHGREDRELEAALCAEAPGILAQLVDQASAWWRERLRRPQVMLDELEAYRESQDVYGQFIAEVIETGPGFKVLRTEVYEAYTRWCQASGERADTRSVCYRKLFAKGWVPSKSVGARYFEGRRIRQKPVAPERATG